MIPGNLKKLPFWVLSGSFAGAYVLKSPQYTKYSGLSKTFAGTKFLAQNTQKQFLEAALSLPLVNEFKSGWIWPKHTKRKNPEIVKIPGFCSFCVEKFRSALGELRSATGGFEAVLNILLTKKSLVFKHFLTVCPVLTYVLTQRNGGFHRLLFGESGVYSGI